MKENHKKRYLLLTLFLLVIVAITGTYAWLSHRTNDTAMVLTVGNINNLRITLSPYQINKKIAPALTYEGEPYTTVTAVNNSTVAQDVRLFYKVYNIDSELAISEFTYTILKSTDGGSTYTPIDSSGSLKTSGASDYDITGNFSNATNGSEILILNESIPAGSTYLYQVYVWLDGSSNQNLVSNKSFNAELNAEIISLPDEYQQVEYIKSTGSQWINTDVLPNDNLKIYIKYAWTKFPSSSSTYVAVYGTYSSENYNTTRLINRGNSITYYNINSRAGSSSSFSYVRSLDTIYEETIWRNGSITYYKSSATSTTASFVITSGTALNQKLAIFAENPSGIIKSSIKLYKMMVYNNNILTYNFIPCYRIEDGVAGLYDTVNGVFYTNQGTGDFLVGPNVNQVGNYYRVTFDANGGSVTTTATVVQYGSVYGALPEPTRTGYTFKGWNGSNLFVESDLVASNKWQKNQNVIVTKTDDYVQVIYNQNSSTPGYITYVPNTILINGTKYTISAYAKGVSNNADYLYLGVYGNNMSIFTLSSASFSVLTKTFTYTQKQTDNNYILIYNNPTTIGTGFQIKWFKIEEGTVATPYEPYYIEDNVEVVQNKNHTLKAIWEANS